MKSKQRTQANLNDFITLLWNNPGYIFDTANTRGFAWEENSRNRFGAPVALGRNKNSDL